MLLLLLAGVPRPNRSAKGSSTAGAAAAAGAPASLLVLLGAWAFDGVPLLGGGGRMPALVALCKGDGASQPNLVSARAP